MQILTQLAGIAQLAQRCSRTALSIICAIVQRHITSETWMPFLQEACPPVLMMLAQSRTCQR